MTTTTGRGIAVTGPQLIFSEDGSRCYAFSGQHTLNNSTATHFEFAPHKHLIEGQYQITYDMTNMDNNRMSGFDIYFNDVLVVELKSTYQDGEATVPLPFYFSIPPLTAVKIIASTQLPSNLPSFGVFLGKVHM